MSAFKSTTGILLILAVCGSANTIRNAQTIYDGGDYTKAGLRTLSLIKNVTDVLTQYPRENMVNSSDAIMGTLRQFY